MEIQQTEASGYCFEIILWMPEKKVSNGIRIIKNERNFLWQIRSSVTDIDPPDSIAMMNDVC